MSNVAQMPSAEERNNKRRLHLREVQQDQQMPLSVGAALRAARAERGEDIAVVAAKLKMRRDLLEAIEGGDYARLPGRTYTMGFIRAYARHLELDADALIQRFKDDEGAAEELSNPVNLVFPEAQEVKHVPNGSILILALVVAIVIYAVSYLTMPGRKSPTVAKADGPIAEFVEPAPAFSATPAAVSDPVAATPTDAPFARPDPVATTITFVSGGSKLPATVLPDAIAPPAKSSAKSNDAFDVAALFRSVTLGTVEASSPQAVPQVASENVHTGARIVLTALEPTYVRIKDPRQPEGKGIYIDRVLKPGESVSAPERSGLLMQTGNAGGLHVAVDGRSAGVMGKRGEVVTRIPVDPSYFLKRVPASQ